jgi:Type VI secretion system/phage-baseplate injector OB domain
MGVYMVPPIGAGVWVEFEQGDPGKPIWSGCRFGTGDTPTLALAGNPADPNICIQSLLQHMVMVSDMPPSPVTGGIILKSTTGAMIVVNDSGIYISNGKGATITMVGPTIDFNVGALTIT